MPPLLRLRVCTLFVFIVLTATSTPADKLEITSTPSGATVEIDGVSIGTTPLDRNFPGGYFHRPRTALGSRLEHPMVARINLPGYATKELPLTEGPMNWIGLNGRNHGEYWLLKSNHFHVDLDPISDVFTGTVVARVDASSVSALESELPLGELIARTKPAIVYLKGLEKAGTGFLVSDTGVVATNAHVARGEGSLLTLLPGGRQVGAKVVYIDADLDIALAKIDGSGFPHLTLADASTVHQGENVLAIGNPGDAMLFSVTKGIVSAVGQFPSAGPGTWIQTDTPINPGNSGGPLLNARGEVVGINTQKLVQKNVSGIGFALSATDLLKVLHQFYPNISTSAGTSAAALDTPSKSLNAAISAQNLAIAAKEPPPAGDISRDRDVSNDPSVDYTAQKRIGFGTITINSDPDGADILVDDKFVGNSPAKLKLSAGAHTIVLRCRKCTEWKREIEVIKDSQVTLAGELQRE
jgi:serine protease Do